MLASLVLAALLDRAAPNAAPVALRSTVTVGGACSFDCKRGELVLGAGEIVERRDDGWLVVLTARHVVDKLVRPLVYVRDDQWPATRFTDLWEARRGRPGYVIARADDADLALVAFRPRTWDAYSVAALADGLPLDGDIVGDPDGALWTVSPFHFLESAPDTFVVNCDTCGPGDSGGGAFDARGRLAGILVRQRVDPHHLVDGEAAGTTQFQVVSLAKVRAFLDGAARTASRGATPAAAPTLPPYAEAWSRFQAMRASAAIR